MIVTGWISIKFPCRDVLFRADRWRVQVSGDFNAAARHMDSLEES
jgi:hypothetical protein